MIVFSVTACTASLDTAPTTTADPDLVTASSSQDPIASTASNGTSTTSQAGDIDYREYVETALELMERFYYATDQVDWDPVREAALDNLTADPSREEAYGAIRAALLELGDPHSRFEPPRMRQDLAELQGETPEPSGERVGQVGYLKLPGIANYVIDPNDPKFYADRVNELLEELDTPEHACGWIVDLRDNGGGTAGPMFASLGPLLGQGVVLTATGPAGTQTLTVKEDHRVDVGGELATHEPPADLPLLKEWSLAGSTVEETQTLIEAARTPSESLYQPVLADPPVAVLISGSTRSAAEYLTIAFLGRDNTQTFGQTTFGIPTGVGGAQFVDGGVLALAGMAPADRLGRSYTSNIFPDNFIAPSPPSEDQTLDAALEWLATQPTCS